MGSPAFAEALLTLGEPNLVIGIVSDIHLRGTDTAATFQHTLEYFRSIRVDGVIIAGDMADQGLESQLKVVADTWFKVFPDDKGLDGRHTERLFIYGNHDLEGYTWGGTIDSVGSETANAQGIGRRPGEVWKKYFGEEYTPIWMKTVGGYHFIGAHWHPNNIPGLSEVLGEHASELTGEKPFFYIQHPHLKNTCNGPWAWGQDDGSVTRLLSGYPNAVAFSGHSHSPLTDDRNLWQGDFTSIGTASLRYLYPMPARENTYQDDSNIRPVYQMPNMDCSQGRQGMVMRVYDNCLTFERREFVYDQQVGDNWMLPWPISQSQPLTFDYRAGTAAIPQFPAGAVATATQADGRDRNGTPTRQVTVHFPNVLQKDTGVRAFDFEVQVEWEWLDARFISATKRVFSPGSLFSEAQDQNEVTCVFAVDELPKDRRYRFLVRPCNCYSGKGNPISTEWTTTSQIPGALGSSLQLDRQFYKAGDAITATFKDAPVGTDAWVGIYAAGKTPGTADRSVAYQYTKVKDGSVSMSVSNAGEYFAVLFKDGGYSECSERIQFFVTSRAFVPEDFQMKTDKTVYNVGNPVRVSLTNAPAISKDWVGIYAEDVVPRDVKCPSYLYNTRISGTLSLNVSGTTNWTSALPAGLYFVGYFMADGYAEPFPRQHIVIGRPCKLTSDKTACTTADEVTFRYGGLPSQLPCHLCRQAEGETSWTAVHALTGTEGTQQMGMLPEGTHRYAVCIDGTPVSPILTVQVKADGDAVAAPKATRRSASVFHVDGRQAAGTLDSLPSGLYVVGGSKILK